MDNMAAVLLAGWLVGLAKGGLGPLGVVITPLMILAMPDSPPDRAVALVLLILIVGDWFALYAYWRQWEAWRMRLLLLGAVVGIVPGFFLLTSQPPGLVKSIIGLIGLLMAAYTVLERRLTRIAYRPRQWHALPAGGMSGFTSAMANAGGAPFSAYMLLQSVSPRVYVATGTLFFTTVNLMKLPLFVANGAIRLELLPAIAPGVLLVPVGVWVGKKIVDRINWGVFAAMVWVGLVVSSVLLLAQ